MKKSSFKSNEYDETNELDRIAKLVVDAAYHVHANLGPGLLESVYEKCLLYELTKRGIKSSRQQDLPIKYDGLILDGGLGLDILVEDKIVVEIKSVDSILSIHRAQLLTYLKLSERPLGFLINFNVLKFKNGIERMAL